MPPDSGSTSSLARSASCTNSSSSVGARPRLGVGQVEVAPVDDQVLLDRQLHVQACPAAARRRGGRGSAAPWVAGSMPSTRQRPRRDRRDAADHAHRRVLPAPLGPRKPNDSPGATSKSMPSTAMNSPKRLVRPRAWMSAGCHRLGMCRWYPAAPPRRVRSADRRRHTGFTGYRPAQRLRGRPGRSCARTRHVGIAVDAVTQRRGLAGHVPKLVRSRPRVVTQHLAEGGHRGGQPEVRIGPPVVVRQVAGLDVLRECCSEPVAGSSQRSRTVARWPSPSRQGWTSYSAVTVRPEPTSPASTLGIPEALVGHRPVLVADQAVAVDRVGIELDLDLGVSRDGLERAGQPASEDRSASAGR